MKRVLSLTLQVVFFLTLSLLPSVTLAVLLLSAYFQYQQPGSCLCCKLSNSAFSARCLGPTKRPPPSCRTGLRKWSSGIAACRHWLPKVNMMHWYLKKKKKKFKKTLCTGLALSLKVIKNLGRMGCTFQGLESLKTEQGL